MSGLGWHLRTVDNDVNGQRKAEQKSFYEALVKSLHRASEILHFGACTGASSSWEHLIAELKYRPADLSCYFIGSVAVDKHPLAEVELLA